MSHCPSAVPDIPLLGDTHLSLDVEQGEVANAPSNRAMIRLKVPF